MEKLTSTVLCGDDFMLTKKKKRKSFICIMNHDIKKNGISRHDSDPGRKSFEVGRIPEKKSKQKMCDNSEYKKCNLELVFLLEV